MEGLETFAQIYQRASERKGGEGRLEALLSTPLSSEQLKTVGDDRFLAEFTRKIFQSGFVWRVVDQKWPDFEKAFFNFDIEKVLLMSDEMFEQRAQDPSIIRNFSKIKTVRDNALMIEDVRRREGSFATFIAEWPGEDIVGLWDYLKKHGARLGGNTGAYALRVMGKDTFTLGSDVKNYFVQRKIVTGSVTSKRSLGAIQDGFNQLRSESGRSLQEISKVIAYSVGDNFVQVDN